MTLSGRRPRAFHRSGNQRISRDPQLPWGSLLQSGRRSGAFRCSTPLDTGMSFGAGSSRRLLTSSRRTPRLPAPHVPPVSPDYQRAIFSGSSFVVSDLRVAVAEAVPVSIVVVTCVATVPVRRVVTIRTPHCRIAEIVAMPEFGVPETTVLIPPAKSTVASSWSRQREAAGDNQECSRDPGTPGRAK
jgi:hypothetical protein